MRSPKQRRGRSFRLSAADECRIMVLRGEFLSKLDLALLRIATLPVLCLELNLIRPRDSVDDFLVYCSVTHTVELIDLWEAQRLRVESVISNALQRSAFSNVSVARMC